MSLRAVVAAFDAIAMVALALLLTGGSVGMPRDALVIWGSTAAAVVAAVVVLTGAAPLVGWLAVGYVLFAAQESASRLALVLVLLAIALVPLLPRPRRSLAVGIATAALTAVALAVAERALPPL